MPTAASFIIAAWSLSRGLRLLCPGNNRLNVLYFAMQLSLKLFYLDGIPDEPFWLLGRLIFSHLLPRLWAFKVVVNRLIITILVVSCPREQLLNVWVAAFMWSLIIGDHSCSLCGTKCTLPPWGFLQLMLHWWVLNWLIQLLIRWSLLLLIVWMLDNLTRLRCVSGLIVKL